MVNKRGQGAFLRAEILAAATRLLGRATSRDAVTLRAIAREAGIAAPSIYAHFADRDDVLDIVVSDTFRVLESACHRAVASATTGIERIRAISHAYLDFAEQHRSAYRILFERSAANTGTDLHAYPNGLQAFGALLDAFEQTAAEQMTTGQMTTGQTTTGQTTSRAREVPRAPTKQARTEGRPRHPDPVRNAQVLWAALHGIVTIVPATPGFPWVPQHDLVDHLIDALTG